MKENEVHRDSEINGFHHRTSFSDEMPLIRKELLRPPRQFHKPTTKLLIFLNYLSLFKPSSHYYVCVLCVLPYNFSSIQFEHNMRTILLLDFHRPLMLCLCMCLCLCLCQRPVSMGSVSLFCVCVNFFSFSWFFHCLILIRFLYGIMLRRAFENYWRWLCVCIVAFCTCAFAFKVWCTYLHISILALPLSLSLLHHSSSFALHFVYTMFTHSM